MFAGHLPTMHFGLAEWQELPVWTPKYEGDGLFEPGNHRVMARNNRAIVVHIPSRFSVDDTVYAVRPIIRVPMGRS